VQRLVAQLRPAGVPLVYFGLNAAHLYEDIRETGVDVVGVDWRTELQEASRRLGPSFAVQGNLDPTVLLSTPERIAIKAREVLASGSQAPGHIFNLGHGILPGTPVENAQALIEVVRGASVPA
jgi:uroporphyrinogen decarboxylase